ncbi:hypothetical protein DER46DRAFT_510536 [Fusarium sp. MPI-SDFR-AT-0072]|nr:hypothetical protein DER46DRAFT_510536 [Fusarium sp. MPI-SDFR-AT-0072]
MPLDLSIALLLTATFLAAWQTIQWHVATRGPISQARTITKLNSRFYSSASLAFIILLLFPQFEGQARSIFHFSKFYEYIDVFGVCAAGINIDLHFGFHHLTTPYLTLVRVLWYSEGWKVVAGLNAFHHFLMYAYFGGVGVLQAVLYVTGTFQLVVGLIGEYWILQRKVSHEESDIWPHIFGFGLLSTYLVLWLQSLWVGKRQDNSKDKSS